MDCCEDVPLCVPWHKVSEETGKRVRQVHPRRCSEVSEEEVEEEMEKEEEKGKLKSNWNTIFV